MPNGQKWTPEQRAKFKETMAAKAVEKKLGRAGTAAVAPIKSSAVAESHFMKFIRNPDLSYYLQIGPFHSREEIIQFIAKIIGV